ncbi:hypothetical protein BN159_0480 [Streptomyces davaonensis JCM 4913]|uniref:Uncharacterized protein n=1 Tax=Streptomyces davaonensis (strain DSM 101723 / JCM 4913 / KCC S-0913 / 768) TaxID=1214101 RepID=K4QWW6_STRDJ|nr:hypothetical protein [Streptomyces davaonensis]CCK24859.1 hypothetical protein BN159_0480 [Streptomyces davaonensis JCM 4913]
MPLPNSLATAEEIHTHLVDQLNLALRRPGMFGGEMALRILIDHLLFVERQPEAIDQQQREWEDRGLWTSIGVAGAFCDLIPGRNYEYGMASVYAEFAQRRGWLKPDEVLAAGAYDALRGRVRQWAAEDRTWPDVTVEFGAPSVLFGGSNPLYGKTLGYLSEDPTQPMVVFHLWNGTASETDSWPPDHEQPLLLAVRFGEGPFRRSFTFTPEGERRKPQQTSPECG